MKYILLCFFLILPFNSCAQSGFELIFYHFPQLSSNYFNHGFVESIWETPSGEPLVAYDGKFDISIHEMREHFTYDTLAPYKSIFPIVYSSLSDSTIIVFFKALLQYDFDPNHTTFCMFLYNKNTNVLYCRYKNLICDYESDFDVIYILKNRKCIGRIIYNNENDICRDIDAYSTITITEIDENRMETSYWLDLRDWGLKEGQTGKMMTKQVPFLDEMLDAVANKKDKLNLMGTKRLAEREKVNINYAEYIFSKEMGID